MTSQNTVGETIRAILSDAHTPDYDVVGWSRGRRVVRSVVRLTETLLMMTLVIGAVWGGITLWANNYEESTTIVTVCDVSSSEDDKGQIHYGIETSNGDDFRIAHKDGEFFERNKAYRLVHDGWNRISSFNEERDATPSPCD